MTRGNVGRNHPRSITWPVSVTDACALASLLGETIASSDSWESKQKTLMLGLCDLIGAHGWTALFCPDDGRSSFQPHVDSAIIGTMAAHLADMSLALPPVSENQTCPGINPARTMLFSGKSLHGGGSRLICVFREHDHPPYTAREERLARIILDEVPWLHEPTTPPEKRSIPVMSPRRQQIFNLLLQGLDRKAIAGRLQISSHTVCDHQKALYRELGVGNQIALMRNHPYPQGNQP